MSAMCWIVRFTRMAAPPRRLLDGWFASINNSISSSLLCSPAAFQATILRALVLSLAYMLCPFLSEEEVMELASWLDILVTIDALHGRHESAYGCCYWQGQLRSFVVQPLC
ncbi:uncharacterized protein LOC115768423 [Drosophila novamexicana]|uniref:uncharacterized protein LOC115768413 n=1 Tax=Drosophila novamexicana TaxID=47314 RepID=UPI0011E5C5A8|nr:uncharacterized protein LOC115768413 [Drosophila novamexicana]XP_030568844.1 uncharacterized protein LOC115768414 [Drosophila novamexicana]XP_030568851.1 uncharacterized protein LOC115768423 [Drosophila novamexicana]